MEAQADDDELAEVVLETVTEQPEPRRRLSEWSPEVEALAAVVDRLSEVVGVLVVANGGKNPRIKPFLRPVVAADRIRSRKAREQHEHVLSLIRFEPEDAGA